MHFIFRLVLCVCDNTYVFISKLLLWYEKNVQVIVRAYKVSAPKTNITQAHIAIRHTIFCICIWIWALSTHTHTERNRIWIQQEMIKACAEAKKKSLRNVYKKEESQHNQISCTTVTCHWIALLYWQQLDLTFFVVTSRIFRYSFFSSIFPLYKNGRKISLDVIERNRACIHVRSQFKLLLFSTRMKETNLYIFIKKKYFYMRHESC